MIAVTGQSYTDKVSTIMTGSPASMDTLSSIQSESLAALHELNMRLQQIADRLNGPMPLPVESGNKQANEPSVLDIARFIRGQLTGAHETLNRIQNAI